MNKEQIAKNVIEVFKTEHEAPVTELNFEDEMQLTVAVALSAQTTDVKVNEVTSTLFKKYKSWEDFANADLEQMQSDIHGVNFHKGKADRLIKMGKVMVSDFKGVLPKTIEELIKLPGVARKSANVIQQELWGIAEGIVVDTHVSRVSNRLGLTTEKDPKKIEKDLMALVPKDQWRRFSGATVLHGRYVCKARKPDCENCSLNAFCPSAFQV